MRVCNRGHQYPFKRRKSGKLVSCGECLKQWSMDNPESRRSSRRLWELKTKYGMTLSDYEKILDRQNGCCAGCMRPKENFKRNLYVDHDHSTKKVRGLLCNDCNIVLGKVRDETKTLRNLTQYLQGEMS